MLDGLEVAMIESSSSSSARIDMFDIPMLDGLEVVMIEVFLFLGLPFGLISDTKLSLGLEYFLFGVFFLSDFLIAPGM